MELPIVVHFPAKLQEKITDHYSLGIYTINTPRPFSETTHTGVCVVLINL